MPQVSAVVSVGYPLGMLSRFFLGSRSAWQALIEDGVRAGRPCLLFLGDQDQFTGVDTLQGLVDEEKRGSNRGGVASKSAGAQCVEITDNSTVLAEREKVLQLIVVPGCDHFFHGNLDDHVAEVAMKWLGEHVHG
jgi:hypothetical protein